MLTQNSLGMLRDCSFNLL